MTAAGLLGAVGLLSTAAVDPNATGEIRGSVRFHGPRPAMKVIDFSSNPQCEREHHKKQVREETVIVNPNGTLRNTLVWLKAGVPQRHWETPFSTVTLTQAGCVYQPHVLALMTNQDLEIRNEDPVNHNVHMESTVNLGSSEIEFPRGESLHKRYLRQEVWFPVGCSVHPWMHAYVAVIAHPFFAVTGPDGSFDLKGVPPGEYTVEAVHEKYGRKEQHVTVQPHQVKSMEFAYGG
jgi:hypothetical protein